ncbi:MAG: phosphoenolpyruvate--protein phosphotransferase [Gemmatimonadales bacterium]|jgi:phosphotransferase system enzyme I (PtsI)
MDDRLLRGFGVSPGITVGPARVIRWELPTVRRSVVPADQVVEEIQRLRDAIAAVRALLEDLRERTRQRAGPEEAKIFDAQIMMLEDPEFRRDVETLIDENQLSAARAFEFKTLEMRALWSQSPSFQLRQRVADLAGIQIMVLNHLLGETVEELLETETGRAAVVFTRELTPGLTVQLEREQVAGFVSQEGTQTAHAAILARSLGIPCVMGLVEGLDRVRDGMEVVLDGTHGIVLLDPTPAELEEAREAEQLRRQLQRQLESVVGQPSVTKDDVTVTLRGNVDMPEEVDGALRHGAEGVGLLRTEFLVLGRTELPGETEQADFFQRAAKRFAPHPVVIRSFDLGGDKFPTAFQTAPEANPFLGWRAIRVCLDHPEIFRVQLRAILRASAVGNVKLMLPMVTQVEEITCTRDYVAEERAALEREGIETADDLPVGVMVETPAAAMLAERMAERADFLSIGTNDLTQYTLAVDRGNARLAGRFTPHHPAMVQFLKRVIDAAQAQDVEASVCGEMASDPVGAFLLLGLGYRVLSVSGPSLPLIRWLVRHIEVEGATAAADEVLEASTTAGVDAVLYDALRRYVDLDLLRAGRLPRVSGTTTLNEP